MTLDELLSDVEESIGVTPVVCISEAVSAQGVSLCGVTVTLRPFPPSA